MVFGFWTKICEILTAVLLLCPLSVILDELQNQTSDLKNDTSAAETLFKRLYKLERNEQLAAVKALLMLEKPDRKMKMLEAIAAKVLYVIEGSKLILDDEKFVPGETAFPSDERIRDALANVLENTAFIGDIVVRLPTMSRKVLKQRPEWVELLQWSLNFTNQSKLIDGKTIKLLDLVSQIMDITDKKPDFHNPYSTEKVEIKPRTEENKKKPKKKKVTNKGPKLSRLSGDL